VDDDIDWSNDEQIYKRVERQYWKFVEYQEGEEYKVEYAADLNASKFGNGFGMRGQKVLDANQLKYTEHPWNFINFQN